MNCDECLYLQVDTEKSHAQCTLCEKAHPLLKFIFSSGRLVFLFADPAKSGSFILPNEETPTETEMDEIARQEDWVRESKGVWRQKAIVN